MTGRRQRIQIGDSDENIERVVQHHRAMISLGIETGYVEHRRDSLPVWRPINPAALGLDHSWLDGVWRNIYDWTLSVRPSRAQPDAGLVEYEIAGTSVSLPGAALEVTPALQRFLMQHLRQSRRGSALMPKAAS